MARTYTVTVTDDETGVVIFAGRPTGHMMMALATDAPGRLVCDRCESPVADDLAGMDAEGPTTKRHRTCRHCNRSIGLRSIRDQERRGAVAKPLELASTAWADTYMAPFLYCSFSPDSIHHPAP